ncbi:hypothetical protein FQR65_LT02680 [Abscondita terminalis]|nr:hypothetical protein FQR65_LT02680 [Abscondita terminalis]
MMNAIVKLKNFAMVARSFSSKPSYEEIKIPLSWGHIAAKWWGPQDSRPILVLHGWQDNCGSFDRLIPLLNQRRGYLAIDFPGHGLSSNLPLGTSYYWTDYVTTVRRVVQHFNWPKVSILGHSIGAAMGYYYELSYSREVDFLICIDALHPIMRDLNVISHGKAIDTILKYEQLIARGDEGPLYSKEELVEKLHSDSFASIDLNMCDIY